MTQNQIRYLQLQEDMRANLAKETELNRSNLENERLARERFSYEKYGKSPIGQTVQAGKAIIGDVATHGAEVAAPIIRTITGTDPSVNALGESITNPTNPETDKSMTSHKEGNLVGGFDYKKDVAKSSYMSMSYNDLVKEAMKHRHDRSFTDSQKRELKNAIIAKHNVNGFPLQNEPWFTYL